MSDDTLDIAWCRAPGEAQELATFFAANVTPEYISHAELQGPRALGIGEWRPGLVDIFAREISERITKWEAGVASRGASYPVLAARLDRRLAGLALVSFFADAPIPYGIVEDIVTEEQRRARGLGAAIMAWIEREAAARGCIRLFLESGLANERAHHFFERQGFKTCSVVMMKDIRKSP